jgi:hypothetical protein
MLIMKQLQKTIFFISVAALFLFSSSAFVYAQYETQETTTVTIPDTGVFTANQTTTVGVSIDIAGTPGATGSVSTYVPTGNPQPNAAIPTNTTLTHFIVISFNMSSSDFLGANITVHYTDSDVAGITQPFKMLKYIAESNSYIVLTATSFDYTAKTVTFSVSSHTDPLFAIGGSTAAATPPPTTPTWLWATVIVVVVIIVLAAVMLLRSRRSK